MALGFEFSETMTGSYHLLDAPGEERPISIDVRASVTDLRSFCVDPTASIVGEVHATEWADHKPLEGTLEINPLLRKRLVYEFRFLNNDGAECVFRGRKEVEARHLIRTMTTLPASIFVGEREVARAILRFRMREHLAPMLRSVKKR